MPKFDNIQQPPGRVVVVVEGAQDAAFFQHLAVKRGISGVTTAHPTAETGGGGRGGMGGLLRALKTIPGFAATQSLIVVSDNDDNPKASLKATQAQISNAGDYGVPAQSLQWANSKAGLPRVAIIMLPSAGDVGSLETLLWPAAATKWPKEALCVEAFDKCVGTGGWAPQRRAKMRLRALTTSTCAEPNIGLQFIWSKDAATEIPLDHSAFDSIASFVAAS